jgi:hypothetical protein
MSEPIEKQLKACSVVLLALLLLVLAAVLLASTAYGQDCPTENPLDSHTWVFRHSDDMLSGDVIRAYTEDGQCIGEQEWQVGQNNGIAVKGQIDSSTRLIESGDPIIFRVHRDTASSRITNMVLEDTEIGPSPSTYAPNGVSVVSDFTFDFGGSGGPELQVYVPSDTITVASDQDSARVPLHLRVSEDDTIHAYQVEVQGHAVVRLGDTEVASYSTTQDTDSSTIYQAVGTAYPGGGVPGEVTHSTPELFLPAPAHGDTLSATILRASIVGDNDRTHYDVSYPNGRTVRWTRVLEDDLNGDGSVTLADVIVALARATDPAETGRWLVRALLIYRSL